MRFVVLALVLAPIVATAKPVKPEPSVKVARLDEPWDRRPDGDDKVLDVAGRRLYGCYQDARQKHGRFEASFSLVLKIDSGGRGRAFAPIKEREPRIAMAKACSLKRLDETRFPTGSARSIKVLVSMRFGA